MLFSLIASLALAACGPQASLPANNVSAATIPATPVATETPAAALPAAQATGSGQPDGEARTIALAGGHSITLTPFRTVEKSGLSDSQCGVTIDGQRLMTMGAGETEVYTCYRLTGAGALPADGAVPRIGLLYDVGSPNAQFATAVILRKEAASWAVDEARAGEFDSKPEAKSLEALAKALR
jgi:hypothetical protein